MKKKDRREITFSPIVTEVDGALNDSWMTEPKGARVSRTRSPH